jgi:hypothetical protein
MAQIIAGGFQNIVPADNAIERLMQAGISREYICQYRVNPPGMHDEFPVGGDRDESPGAHKATSGAAVGAVVGAAAGLAAGAAITPMLGPAGVVAGAATGAYTASLVGGMGNTEKGAAQPQPEDMRPAEALVAVNADAAGIAPEEIVRIFEECGAWQVERAEGVWAEGEWKDFDPVSLPHLVGGSDLATQGTGIQARH